MRSRNRITHQKGFTLIEIIAVLVLVGILAAFAGLGLATGVRGYLLASENAAMSQKAQIAMTRLSREIIECFNCDGNNTYPSDLSVATFTFENNLGARILTLDGDELKLTGHTLVDQVSDFSISRQDGRIIIELEMNHTQGSTTRTFTTSILPRNI